MKFQDRVICNSLVHNFRNRSRFPLQSLWDSSSGLRAYTTVFGVLSAVGIILAVNDTKVREFISMLSFSVVETSSSYWFVPGLENLGNNCFLNVVLQSLSSCSSFQKYLAEIAKCDFLLAEEGRESMPLFNSLALLLEELGIVRHKRTVLSPRGMMHAMDHYKPNFSRTRQQDAEEAFSHLLSMLREELSDHYVPNKSYISDLHPLSCGRIITECSEEESEWKMWKRIFLGPFDGIIGSILICLSCSFQISLDFQHFHSLHLSPFVSNNGAFVDRYNLEDCLKNFFVAEPLNNYCCSNCWHNAAIKYLSILSDNKTDSEILQRCNRNYSCDCKTLASLEAFPWSNRSRIFKQLSLARSPKILCIHIQRASYDMLGQPVKLLGHITFPSILDLSSFIKCEVGIKKRVKLSQSGLEDVKYKLLSPYSVYQYKIRVAESVSNKTDAAREHERTAVIHQYGLYSSASEVKSTLLSSRRHIDSNDSFSSQASEGDPKLTSSRKSAGANVGVRLPSPSKTQKYRLVSVVKHFESSGSGRYIVYRRVTSKIHDEYPAGLLESAIEQWYRISDSEVIAVSENDALGANASVLFYEKINCSRT